MAYLCFGWEEQNAFTVLVLHAVQGHAVELRSVELHLSCGIGILPQHDLPCCPLNDGFVFS